MVKTIILITLFFSTLTAKIPHLKLQTNCINCHIKQQIPSELIYRKYLQKYSTHRIIKQTLFKFLKNPTKEHSIMPKQFFLKFPEKKALELNTTVLEESIDAYLEYFDVKKKLVLP
jgi:hypothetical protein